MAWALPLGAHERIDKFGCANGYTHAFQARYSDDIKLGFCEILFIEFTETLERVVMVGGCLEGDDDRPFIVLTETKPMYRCSNRRRNQPSEHYYGGRTRDL